MGGTVELCSAVVAYASPGAMLRPQGEHGVPLLLSSAGLSGSIAGGVWTTTTASV